MNKHQIENSQSNRKLKAKCYYIAMLACVFLASSFGTFAFCKYFLTKHDDAQKLAKSSTTSSTPQDRQAAEGTDESAVQDSTIDSYKVAADRPRLITIAAIGVRARILPMGVNPDKSVQAPINIHDSGWYVDSAKPGSIGTALIDGHDIGATSDGVFVKLGNLKPGQMITIEMGNGTKHQYVVKSLETKPLDQVNMTDVLGLNNSDNEAHLSIITCTGKVIRQGKKVTQDHRIIVRADLVIK